MDPRDREFIGTVAEARGLIADGTAKGGMIPKLETAIQAVEKGVGAAVIMDGRTLSRTELVICGMIVIGIAGFAGGIYGLRIMAGIASGPWLNVVPFGGVCLILGWLAVALAAWRR